MTNEIVVTTESEWVGEFESLNFVLDHEKMDFVGYEFNGKEIHVEEIGCEQSLFRCDKCKETGEVVVYSAYSQDFDIMEEVTHYFDTKKLLEDIAEHMKNNEVDNQGDVYVEYVRLREEEGYDCDDAVYEAYEIVRSRQKEGTSNE